MDSSGEEFVAGKAEPGHRDDATSPGVTAEFGGYELHEEIGRGGMGIVYRARHKRLDRVVALKVLLTRCQVSPTELARFEREAVAAARLRHPGVVQVYDAGHWSGQSYIAMEYVEGQDLEDHVQDRQLPAKEAARLVSSIARAVHHMHAEGILHRDIKPSNILMDRTGRPKVTDFGLAQLLESSERLTGTRNIAGTPNYMSPEQAYPPLGPMGPWSDVHALGSVLYRLLAGEPPYVGETPLKTVLMVIKSTPPKLRVAGGPPPRPLEAIYSKCMEKNPQNRYQSAGELADELDRFVEGKAVEAEGTGPWVQLRRWVERETNLAAHLAVLVLLALVYLGIVLLAPGLAGPRDHTLAATLAVWSGCCLALRAMERRGAGVTLAWGVLDVVFLTGLLLLFHGLRSMGMMGYPLAIIMAGVSLEPRAVKTTTLMSLVALGALMLDSYTLHPERQVPVDHLVIAAVMMIASGAITVRQVRHTRALSAYLDQKVGDEDVRGSG